MVNVFDSWWVIGAFAAAAVLNLILFNPNNIGTWYSVSLAVIVCFCVAAGAVHSPAMGLVGVAAMIVLVGTGIVVKVRERRRRPRRG